MRPAARVVAQLKIFRSGARARTYVYAPFSIEEVFVGIWYADTDIILAVTDLLDLDISRARRDDNDLLVSRTIVLVVNAAGGLALSAVAVTNTAAVFGSFGIYRPVAADFLKIRIT